MKIIQSSQGAYLKIDGKKYLNLSSNNYLGLASDKLLCKAAVLAIRKYGVGTASVRALVGTNELHVELERKLAEFKKAEDAIALTGGYMANLAAVQTVLDKEDVVVSDELNHASIIDAVRLSGVVNKFVYKHNDTSDLKRIVPEILAKANVCKSNGEKPKILIITDGVFSMDGDIANLPEIVKIAREIGAMVMVDDAHGEGVLGSRGRGIVDHFNLHGKVDIEVGTLSKAFGVIGGFISGKKELIDLFRAKSRQFLFSNGLSVPDAGALIAGVDILSKSDERVKNLWKNADFLKKGLVEHGFDIGHSVTPITPIMVGDEELTVKFAEGLFEEGVLVSAIKFPMVARGKARLRLIPSAIHTEKQLEWGIKRISWVWKKIS